MSILLYFCAAYTIALAVVFTVLIVNEKRVQRRNKNAQKDSIAEKQVGTHIAKP